MDTNTLQAQLEKKADAELTKIVIGIKQAILKIIESHGLSIYKTIVFSDTSKQPATVITREISWVIGHLTDTLESANRENFRKKTVDAFIDQVESLQDQVDQLNAVVQS